mgnify:CR=1 FL=1
MKDVTQTTPGKGKPTPKNNAKESWFKRMKRSIKETLKETFGELRKVTWPSFGETMKQLGAVIAVVLLFLVVLTVFDLILGQGFQQFRQALGQLISLIFKKF